MSHKTPGRVWLDQMLWVEGRDPSLDTDVTHDDSFNKPDSAGGKFVDTYRHLHPDKVNFIN